MSKRGQPRLYKRLTLTTLTTVIGLGGAAQAETYGSGPVLAPVGTIQVSCRVFNFGTNPIMLPTLEIYNGAGTLLAQNFNNCPASLALGASCAFAGVAVVNQQYSCRVVVVGVNADSVSGDVEIVGPGPAILNVLPLRNSHE
jgi:hypothetical protein